MLDFGDQRDLPIILLIDDDPISREVMATVLTMSGYTIYTAEGGAPALKLIADGACVPSVILMDAQMPDLSGTDLIEQLRSSSHARIFTISGSNPPDDVIAAADGFLLKPFTPENLGKLIEKKRPAPSPPEISISAVPTGSPSSAKPYSALPVVNPEILAQLREMMSEPAVRQIYAAISPAAFPFSRLPSPKKTSRKSAASDTQSRADAVWPAPSRPHASARNSNPPLTIWITSRPCLKICAPLPPA